MRRYLYFICYMLLFNSIYSQCDDLDYVRLTMEDSWGDGWNGNEFCINSFISTSSGLLPSMSFLAILSICSLFTLKPTCFVLSGNILDSNILSRAS